MFPNSKVCSLRFQLLFNPNLAMVEVFSRDGIESKKKATACHPTDDVQDCNLGRIKQFSVCESDHSNYLPKKRFKLPCVTTQIERSSYRQKNIPRNKRLPTPSIYVCPFALPFNNLDAPLNVGVIRYKDGTEASVTLQFDATP